MTHKLEITLKYVKIKHSENSSYLIKERIMSIYDETGTFKDPLWV